MVSILPGYSLISPLRVVYIFHTHTQKENKASALSEKMCAKCTATSLAHEKSCIVLAMTSFTCLLNSHLTQLALTTHQGIILVPGIYILIQPSATQ